MQETIDEAAYSPADVSAARRHFVAISGCSGGGKSTLLCELGRRGFEIFAEPGRQIVKEQVAIGGEALPGGNSLAFVELCVSRAMHGMIGAAATKTLVFFDRGIVDAISYLEHLKFDVPVHLRNTAERFRYNEKIFVVPPWPECFRNDAERTHSFEDAVAQYETSLKTYERYGYTCVIVPQGPVSERADFVLHALEGV